MFTRWFLSPTSMQMNEHLWSWMNVNLKQDCGIIKVMKDTNKTRLKFPRVKWLLQKNAKMKSVSLKCMKYSEWNNNRTHYRQ